jgi:uncharacterized membrane protein YcaP (DUF421 family)
MDWGELFAVHVPVAEIVLRGSIIYWFLFLIFRFVLRRDIGSVGVADILLLVIIADASQNAMAGEYKSISEGMLLIATIAGWNLLLDWLAYRSPYIDRLVSPRTLPLVRHGKILQRNMARQFLTKDDLMAKLREHGITRLADVRHAYLEGDGEISVIPVAQARGK